MLIVVGRGPLAGVILPSVLKSDCILHVTNVSFFTFAHIDNVPEDSSLLLLADSDNLISAFHIVISSVLICRRFKLKQFLYVSTSDSYESSELRDGKFSYYRGFDYYSLRKIFIQLCLRACFFLTSTSLVTFVVGICIHPSLGWGRVSSKLKCASSIILPSNYESCYPVTCLDDLTKAIVSCSKSNLYASSRSILIASRWVSATNLIRELSMDSIPQCVHVDFPKKQTYRLHELARTVIKIFFYSFIKPFIRLVKPFHGDTSFDHHNSSKPYFFSRRFYDYA